MSAMAQMKKHAQEPQTPKAAVYGISSRVWPLWALDVALVQKNYSEDCGRDAYQAERKRM